MSSLISTFLDLAIPAITKGVQALLANNDLDNAIATSIEALQDARAKAKFPNLRSDPEVK